MIERLLTQYGYFFVYAGTLFEPDATLVAATYLAHKGMLHLSLVWLFAFLSTLSVSQFWFWLARSKGQEMLGKMAESSPRYARVRTWVEKNNDVLVFFSRFLWGLRIAIDSACGASGVRPIRFFAVDAAGAVVWTAVIGTAGFALAKAIGRFFHYLKPYQDAIALVIVAVMAIIALWKQFQQRQEVRDIIHPSQLGVDAVDHVVRGVHALEDSRQLEDKLS